MAKGSTNKDTTMPQQAFRLMDLPAELRVMIYRHAFYSQPEIDMVEIYESTSVAQISYGAERKLRTALRQPVLTRTNRKIRQESLPLFYKHLTVKAELTSRDARTRALDLDSYTYKWLAAIGPQNRASLGAQLVVPNAKFEHFETSIVFGLQWHGIEDNVEFERVEGFYVPGPTRDFDLVDWLLLAGTDFDTWRLGGLCTQNRSDWVRIRFAPAETSGGAYLFMALSVIVTKVRASRQRERGY